MLDGGKLLNGRPGPAKQTKARPAAACISQLQTRMASQVMDLSNWPSHDEIRGPPSMLLGAKRNAVAMGASGMPERKHQRLPDDWPPDSGRAVGNHSLHHTDAQLDAVTRRPAPGTATMTTKEHSNDLIVYKAKSSTGDIGGREAGANGAYITLPLGADPTRARLCLRHADGVLLSCDIQLIESMEHRQKHVQFLGMSAEMWPEIVNGERTDRYEMFFTVHSTASNIKETDRWLDSRGRPTTLKEETHYELCTCGRDLCQALKLSELRCVPGPLEISSTGKVKQTEMRVCEHRIKSRLTNSIQGRNTKADGRKDKTFWLSIELEAGGESQSLSIFCHDGSSEVARFRVAAKPDEQQHRCSARSCNKKKDSLRLGREQLLVAMSKLGYMGGVDKTESNKRLKRAYGQLRKLCGSSAVPDPAVLMEKFHREHAAGTLDWIRKGLSSGPAPSGNNSGGTAKRQQRSDVEPSPAAGRNCGSHRGALKEGIPPSEPNTTGGRGRVDDARRSSAQEGCEPEVAKQRSFAPPGPKLTPRPQRNWTAVQRQMQERMWTAEAEAAAEGSNDQDSQDDDTDADDEYGETQNPGEYEYAYAYEYEDGEECIRLQARLQQIQQMLEQPLDAPVEPQRQPGAWDL
jgi:hypothetical protein